jgi:HSP20 family molecular chaperone IbpA
MSKEESLTKKKDGDNATSPVFVEAEKMFGRIAEITRETAQKAYDFFQNRGAALGSHLDDWLKAESEILRPTPVEITETNDAVNIRAAVPGFKPDEVEISVKDNILILSGESKSEEKTEGENVFYSEWRSNRFCRQLTLPSEVETENVEAHLKEGVLQLSLKKKEQEEATKIAVKSA